MRGVVRRWVLPGGRGLDEAGETGVDLLDHVVEAVEAGGLDDVGVGVQFVAALDVAGVPGGGQDHHRDDPQVRVSLDLGQDVQAVQAGQVQVQEDQSGPARVGVFAVLAEEPQGLVAVGDQEDYRKLNSKK